VKELPTTRRVRMIDRSRVWNKELLPVRWEKVEVSLRDAFRIRRIYRKLARRKGSGSLRRITVFVRHENLVKLLRFLGYCLE
jgi:hypothetical protein